MSEIDLIPDEYVHWQAQKRVLRWFSVAAICSVVVLALTAAGFKWQNASTQQDLDRLKAEKSITLRQQQRLEALARDHQRFDGRWQLLNGLRSGTRAETVISVVDQVMQEDSVWFIDWRFKRSGKSVEPDQLEANNGTYIISLDTADNSSMSGEGLTNWGIETNLNIKGGADDHAAFSRFVQTLLLQRAVADVRILSTSSSHSKEPSNRIEFEIDVLVNGKPERDHSA